MLGPIYQLLKGRRVILASGSPRRKQILENIVTRFFIAMDPSLAITAISMQAFPFEVVPSRFEENLDKTQYKEAWQYAESTAAGKAEEVAKRLKVRYRQ